MNKINLMADWIVQIKSVQDRDKAQKEGEVQEKRKRGRGKEEERNTADCGKVL